MGGLDGGLTLRRSSVKGLANKALTNIGLAKIGQTEAVDLTQVVRF
jgi:hypothetical protein